MLNLSQHIYLLLDQHHFLHQKFPTPQFQWNRLSLASNKVPPRSQAIQWSPWSSSDSGSSFVNGNVKKDIKKKENMDWTFWWFPLCLFYCILYVLEFFLVSKSSAVGRAIFESPWNQRIPKDRSSRQKSSRSWFRFLATFRSFKFTWSSRQKVLVKTRPTNTKLYQFNVFAKTQQDMEHHPAIAPAARFGSALFSRVEDKQIMKPSSMRKEKAAKVKFLEATHHTVTMIITTSGQPLLHSNLHWCIPKEQLNEDGARGPLGSKTNYWQQYHCLIRYSWMNCCM